MSIYDLTFGSAKGSTSWTFTIRAKTDAHAEQAARRFVRKNSHAVDWACIDLQAGTTYQATHQHGKVTGGLV